MYGHPSATTFCRSYPKAISALATFCRPKSCPPNYGRIKTENIAYLDYLDLCEIVHFFLQLMSILYHGGVTKVEEDDGFALTRVDPFDVFVRK